LAVSACEVLLLGGRRHNIYVVKKPQIFRHKANTFRDPNRTFFKPVSTRTKGNSLFNIGDLSPKLRGARVSNDINGCLSVFLVQNIVTIVNISLMVADNNLPKLIFKEIHIFRFIPILTVTIVFE
jgi:hypothetical protein